LLILGAEAPIQAPPWKQVWSDDFDGPANVSVNAAYWGFDSGRGKFGTGEVETMTSSRHSVHLDGHGHVDIIVGSEVTPMNRP